jgi:hypothetical protein
LIKKLSETIIQIWSSGCKGKYSLENKSCKIINALTPVPKTNKDLQIFRKLLRHSQLLNVKSNYGDILSVKVAGMDMIIKVPKKKKRKIITNMELLQEVFVSFCIINQYINENPRAIKHFLYCYGLFMCPKELKSVNLMYNKIDGNSFQHLVNSGNLTDDEILGVMEKLLLQLIPLQEGPYHLTHYDLHAGNVMISGKDVYIIDYGRASFYYNGYEYFNSVEKLLKDGVIVSGVFDFFMMFMDMYVVTRVEKFMKMLEILIEGIELIVDETPHVLYRRREYYIYENIKPTPKNIKILEERTYSWIYKMWKNVKNEDDEDIEE